MRLHAKALQYFDMIRRCGSIREAARQLHVASSAVNRQLLELEGQLGTPLFERLSAGLRLTAAGEIVAQHVISVLQDARRVEGELEALRGIRRGEVNVVAVEGVTSDLLPAVLARMHETYPGVRVETRSMGSASMSAAVESGDADVALGYSLPATGALQCLAQGRFSIGAVLAADHPLAGNKPISFKECLSSPLILASSELSLHTLLQPLLQRYRGQVEIVTTSNSIELMKRLAERKLGIAFQTCIGLERELAEGRLCLRRLSDRQLAPSDLGAYVRAGRTLPPALDAFIRIVEAELRRRQSGEALAAP
ncbi:LysR family transcriptional regulator [Denitratisoma sp. agr-D3]